MSDEIRVVNSLDDLIHVRIDHWKLFAGHVLVDAMCLTMTSEREGRQVARNPIALDIRPTHSKT